MPKVQYLPGLEQKCNLLKNKFLRTPKTDGWGNKLVTIFADHTRTIFITKEPTNILVNLLATGGLDSVKSGLKTYTWICKNCAMVARPPGQLCG
jgi:hypothetical protein